MCKIMEGKVLARFFSIVVVSKPPNDVVDTNAFPADSATSSQHHSALLLWLCAMTLMDLLHGGPVQ